MSLPIKWGSFYSIIATEKLLYLTHFTGGHFRTLGMSPGSIFMLINHEEPNNGNKDLFFARIMVCGKIFDKVRFTTYKWNNYCEKMKDCPIK